MSYLLPPIDIWKQWGAIFTDVDLWTPVISEICAREGIAYDSIKAGYPGTNAVFLLDRKHVVKVYNPVWKDFGVERELHAALGNVRAIPVPDIVASGQFVEGRPVRELRDELTHCDLVDVAGRLGDIVRALHDTDVTTLEQLTLHETEPRISSRRKVEVVKELRDKRLLPDSVIDEMAAFLESTTTEHGAHPLVLVHGDLTEDHLLLEKRDGRWAITGLIDLGDAHACPPEYEWQALWLSLLGRNTEALRAFFDSYDPTVFDDHDFTQRAFVWSLLHDYGTQIVEEALSRPDAGQVRSLDDLRRLMWPDDIFTRQAHENR